MARTKYTSNKKQQLGQFMTPVNLTDELIKSYTFTKTDKILEPSMGDGNFVISLIDKFINEVYIDGESVENKVLQILENNIVGVELDKTLYHKCIDNIKIKYNIDELKHHFYSADFLLWNHKEKFDYIIGNPPFGGTINLKVQECLDKQYGNRFGKKIKKETYSFFIIKCIEEHLKESGTLLFILSDTFMTIKTMDGLRYFLVKSGTNTVKTIDKFSDETDYSMVTLEFLNRVDHDCITYNGTTMNIKSMESTANFSWYMPNDYQKYFGGKLIGDYMIGSGGLTTGKNELFVRNIKNNTVIEEYDFEYYNKPITLENELKNARYNILSESKKKKILEQEQKGETIIDVNITKTEKRKIKLPHSDYKYYNKSDGKLIYSNPKYAIYWKDDGKAVITYKKNGRWHLRGVGGLKFFGKEGITWQFISSEIKPKYLPEGYILDNSGPILTLRKGVEKDELYFILAWLCSNRATSILKEVINHTRNIQSKDLERLPYPFWVKNDEKNMVINETRKIINNIINDENYNPNDYIKIINKIFDN